MTASADPTGPASLALDDLLTSLPPDTLDALASSLAAAMPAALVDQMGAAATDAGRHLATIAAAVGGTPRGVPADGVPDWVRLGALNALTGWVLDSGSTCMHGPDPRRPQPVRAAAWRPGLIVCTDCGHMLRLPAGSAADRRCDGCGRVTGGVEVDDGIHLGTVQVGMLLYAFGACVDCAPNPVQP